VSLWLANGLGDGPSEAGSRWGGSAGKMSGDGLRAGCNPVEVIATTPASLTKHIWSKQLSDSRETSVHRRDATFQVSKLPEEGQ
jgi:hypothetical protein